MQYAHNTKLSTMLGTASKNYLKTHSRMQLLASADRCTKHTREMIAEHKCTLLHITKTL